MEKKISFPCPFNDICVVQVRVERMLAKINELENKSEMRQLLHN
jgi:hypothetical protein